MADWTLPERLQHSGVRSLLGLLVPHASRLAPARARPVDGLTLHPELQLLLALRDLRGGRPFHKLSVDHARRQTSVESRLSAGPRIWVGPVRDFVIDGPGGPLRVRHYAPPEPGIRPLLVFFHGGGFTVGDIDSHDQPCRMLSKHAGIHVLSVDYRLAPEHPFPAAVEDAYAAFRWAHANARKLGADPKRVGVGGDSAGGNLAAVVGQVARRAGEPLPAMQLLIYPGLDRTRPWPSLDFFRSGFFLETADVDWFTHHYAGGADLTDLRLSPSLETDLSGLGPAIIITAGFDPLRDEGEAYEAALRAAGNVTRFRRVSDLVHGFINMTGVSSACHREVVTMAEMTRDVFASLD